MVIEDYENPFDALLEFERMLSEFTGAPYVVLTDSCTHGIELFFRTIASRESVELPHQTYLSLPMLMRKLEMPYHFSEQQWEIENEYQLKPYAVWDSARLFKEGMYRSRQVQCLSFGHQKPLQIGTGGAILLDNFGLYTELKRMAYDGRAIHEHSKWVEQKEFKVGYHYMMRPEFAVKGMRLLHDGSVNEPPNFNYPDLREITIL